MPQPTKKVWKDGEILDWTDGGRVSLLTHTLHYGVGVFEGVRAYRRTPAGAPASQKTTVFRLREHVERLFDSAKLVFIEPKVSADDVEAGCLSVLRENGLTEGYLRPLIVLGEGPMGLLPDGNPAETYVTAWNWGAYLGASGLADGIRCKVSSFARAPVGSALARGKIIGHYVTGSLAKQEAKRAGCDEALLLDADGYVSEGSGENLFVVRRGELFTPPLSASILPGITRDTILELAREDGIVVREEPLPRDAVYLADEVFLTGTAAEVAPVREVDDRVIGSGKVGELTRALQARYFAVVRGPDDSHPEWLTDL